MGSFPVFSIVATSEPFAKSHCERARLAFVVAERAAPISGAVLVAWEVVVTVSVTVLALWTTVVVEVIVAIDGELVPA